MSRRSLLRNPFRSRPERVALSPKVADEIKTTTCYMCACRCGIQVHLDGGKIRHIEGNPEHPVNRGVLCAKGAAGVMQHNSPARLKTPLLRTGPRGSGEFRAISWDEALGLASQWLGAVRAQDPKKLAFFTGRDQSQALTSWWAKQFGTPNYAAHGGFCSVSMAAAGLYTIGSSFWEFGEPDWEHTRYLMLFGVCEDHSSNPLKIGLGKLKSTAQAKIVSVNPVCTGYSAIADEWLGLTPGTDGLFVLALIHELLRLEHIDFDYLVRYTNAPWLVISDPGAADDGLFARDDHGEPLVYDTASERLTTATTIEIAPALTGARILPDGRLAKPVFQLLSERYRDPAHAPEAVASRIGIAAHDIQRIARELAEVAFKQEIVLEQPWTDWAGRRHERIIGRPVSVHAMRGIAAHSNGFQTCRALHLLQILLGSIDTPGGFRAKPPYPKPCPPHAAPGGRESAPNRPLGAMPLGLPAGPEDLLVDGEGRAMRIDQAFSWEYPFAIHGGLHLLLHNAWAGEPYPIDLLFLSMANMSWNSAMNVPDTLTYLTAQNAAGGYRIPRIIYSDAYHSEMVAYADLVLPDTTYLERWDCISLLDRPIGSPDGPADAIRQPVVKPDREVRPFQDVLLDLGARLALPGMIGEAGGPLYPGGYADYLVRHERAPGIGSLAGWRGEDGTRHGTGAPNPDQLARYVENGCFWQDAFAPDQRYLKHANKAYLEHAAAMGWIEHAAPIVLQLYAEPLQRFRLAGQGHGPVQPPAALRTRLMRHFDPLPIWYPPINEQSDTDGHTATIDFPLHALTQRPMHMYHSWGAQNPWLRQISARNWLYVHPDAAAASGLADQDWVWVVSKVGRVKAQIRLMHALNRHTVWTWNAVGKRAGTWGLQPDAPEATQGFLLNHLIPDRLPQAGDQPASGNADPITGQAAWYDLRVRLEKCAPAEAGLTAPTFAIFPALPEQTQPPATLRFGASFDRTPMPKAATPSHRERLGQPEGQGTSDRAPRHKGRP